VRINSKARGEKDHPHLCKGGERPPTSLRERERERKAVHISAKERERKTPRISAKENAGEKDKKRVGLDWIARREISASKKKRRPTPCTVRRAIRTCFSLLLVARKMMRGGVGVEREHGTQSKPDMLQHELNERVRGFKQQQQVLQ
jgi:hypothetical protein